MADLAGSQRDSQEVRGIDRKENSQQLRALLRKEPSDVYPYSLGLSTSQTFSAQELTEIFEQQSRTLVEQTLAHFKQAGIQAEGVISHLDPREAIQQSVVSSGCDLIVMGSHHHNAVRRALLGSLTSFAVHHAHVPLLIVPLLPA
jgi:nucleotide-binding universal stress UspA family protein